MMQMMTFMIMIMWCWWWLYLISHGCCLHWNSRLWSRDLKRLGSPFWMMMMMMRSFLGEDDDDIFWWTMAPIAAMLLMAMVGWEWWQMAMAMFTVVWWSLQCWHSWQWWLPLDGNDGNGDGNLVCGKPEKMNGRPHWGTPCLLHLATVFFHFCSKDFCPLTSLLKLWQPLHVRIGFRNWWWSSFSFKDCGWWNITLP